MNLRRLHMFGFLRDKAEEGGGGGGAAPPDAELAKLRQENAAFKAKEAEIAKDKERSNGEWNSVIKRYETELEAERAKTAAHAKERDDAKAEAEGHKKAKRADDLGDAVAKALNVSMSPRLRGLLPQTGLDTAPEKLTPEHVAKVAAKVRELDPDLKPSGRPASAPGAGPVGADGKTDYRKLGEILAGKAE